MCGPRRGGIEWGRRCWRRRNCGCAQRSAIMVRLETAVDNAGALSFYKRRGYNVMQTIPHYYSSGVDALLLEKDLLLRIEAMSVSR